MVRVQQAARLMSNGLAPHVILSGQGDCQANARQLALFGVSTNRLSLECASTSTQENALYTVRLLRERGCKRVIIVTSWYHSRRALACFGKYAPEIEFISLPAPRGDTPWRYERNYIAAEYAKMLVYAVQFGILPGVR